MKVWREGEGMQRKGGEKGGGENKDNEGQKGCGEDVKGEKQWEVQQMKGGNEGEKEQE